MDVFECICGIEPFSNGVVITNREYAGMTPLGMTFPELASMTGGGVQTPGFMGHGKHFIGSKKFMKAEGGIERIVWMPKELKETVAERVNQTAKELYGIDNFIDMVGDETIATDPEELVAFLTEKKPSGSFYGSDDVRKIMWRFYPRMRNGRYFPKIRRASRFILLRKIDKKSLV